MTAGEDRDPAEGRAAGCEPTPPGDEKHHPGAVDATQTLFLAASLQRELRGEPGGDAAASDPNREAWSALVEKIQNFVRRVHLRTRLPQTYELQDLQQIVLAKLVADLDRMQLRSREEFWGFVRVVAEHAVRDMWRRSSAQKRGGRREPVSLCDFEGEQRDDLSVDQRTASPSVFLRVEEIGASERECLGELSNAEHREIYELRRFEGLDYVEIVARLGTGRRPETVRVIYHRVRQRVHECLEGRLQGYDLESLRG